MLKVNLIRTVSALALTAALGFASPAKAQSLAFAEGSYGEQGDHLYVRSLSLVKGLPGGWSDFGAMGHLCGAVSTNDGIVYVADTNYWTTQPSQASVVISAFSVKNGVVGTSPIITLIKKFTLPLKSDAKATCSMAATKNYLYFAKNKSVDPVFVTSRSTFATQAMPSLASLGGPTAALSYPVSIVANDTNAVFIFSAGDLTTGARRNVQVVVDANNKILDLNEAQIMQVSGQNSNSNLLNQK